jgi:hypothetical protein
MAPANPLPQQDHSGDSSPTFHQPLDPAMDPDRSTDPSRIDGGPGPGGNSDPEPVSQEELNAWRRGLTPQAEIWNGRLAMLGLSMGLIVLILSRLVSHRG